jgi:hypothetical protein
VRRRFVAAGLAAVLLVPLAVSAAAEEVTVAVSNPGGSRTLIVEDLDGNALTTLDFGTSRAHPFRVRVVDQDMDRAGYQVVSSMTNLYKKTGPGTYDYATQIGSGDVSIDYSSTPLNVTDVTALVSPVFDVTGDLLCTVLGVVPGNSACVIEDVEGLLQDVPLTVDLGNLTNLPLLPGQGTSGPYDDPDYVGVGVADPAKPGTFTPTSIPLGSTSLGGDLSGIQDSLDTLIAGLPTNQLVDTDALLSEVQGLLGPVFDLLGVVPGLPTVDALMADLTATLVDLTGVNILGQSGDLRAYPILNVDVPGTAATGDYEGTYSVTLIQL